MDPRDQPPKDLQPIHDPYLNLSHGYPGEDFSAFHYDFILESNSPTFQVQGVPQKGPHGNLSDYRTNPQDMDWNLGTLAGHPPSSSGLHLNGTYARDELVHSTQAVRPVKGLDLEVPWNPTAAGLT